MVRVWEIYAPAKLIRSKKSTSLLGLVPARILIMWKKQKGKKRKLSYCD